MAPRRRPRSTEAKPTYKFDGKKIVVTVAIDSETEQKTTYYLNDSKVDERREKFTNKTIKELLEQRYIYDESKFGAATEYKMNEDQTYLGIGDDDKTYKFLFDDNSTKYYAPIADKMGKIETACNNNIITITTTEPEETGGKVTIEYIDAAKNEIYKPDRAMDEQDIVNFSKALVDIYKQYTKKRTSFHMTDFVTALCACNFYQKTYLPDPIHITEASTKNLKIAFYYIISFIIKHERIDAEEEDMHPKYTTKIQKAYVDGGNSAPWRTFCNVARGILTAPTLPLLPFTIPLVYIIAKYGTNGQQGVL